MPFEWADLHLICRPSKVGECGVLTPPRPRKMIGGWCEAVQCKKTLFSLV